MQTSNKMLVLNSLVLKIEKKSSLSSFPGCSSWDSPGGNITMVSRNVNSLWGLHILMTGKRVGKYLEALPVH